MEQSSYKFKNSILRTYNAAQKIAPIISESIGIPKSIVDLGGGAGAFLKAFKELGTKEVVCIDHPSIKTEDLLINQDEFIPCNLNKQLPSPIKSELAISTEFAEHVSQARSKSIVDFLTNCSDIILFSSAIPGQGGIEHINEQRPSFWRNLFQARGYEQVDNIRQKIIFDRSIPFWFRQNLFLYVNQKLLEQGKLNIPVQSQFIPPEFEIVHSRILERPLTLRELLKELIPTFTRSVKSRFSQNI